MPVPALVLAKDCRRVIPVEGQHEPLWGIGTVQVAVDKAIAPRCVSGQRQAGHSWLHLDGELAEVRRRAFTGVADTGTSCQDGQCLQWLLTFAQPSFLHTSLANKYFFGVPITFVHPKKGKTTLERRKLLFGGNVLAFAYMAIRHWFIMDARCQCLVGFTLQSITAYAHSC